MNRHIVKLKTKQKIAETKKHDNTAPFKVFQLENAASQCFNFAQSYHQKSAKREAITTLVNNPEKPKKLSKSIVENHYSSKCLNRSIRSRYFYQTEKLRLSKQEGL